MTKGDFGGKAKGKGRKTTTQGGTVKGGASSTTTQGGTNGHEVAKKVKGGASSSSSSWKGPKKTRANDWEGGDERYNQPGYSFTGPQAQDPRCGIAPAETKETIDKIPQPINELDDSAEEGATTKWWGARAEIGRSIPCDICDNVYGVPHAMVQCYLSSGLVPNTAGAGRRIAKAKEEIGFITVEFQHKMNLKDDGESSTTTESSAQSSFEGMTGESLCNMCYKCYGRKFHGDEDYFVNFDKMRLTAKWCNKRNKMKATNKQEDAILEHLFDQCEKKVKGEGADESVLINLAEVKELIMETPGGCACSRLEPSA